MAQASIIALTSLLAALGAGPAQAADAIPPELKRLLPPAASLLDHQTADLNGDGRPDVLFVADTENDDGGGPRSLFIAIRQPDGELRVVKRNDKVVYCRQCGGTMGDPLESIDAGTRSFAVNHYGGSGWRWGNRFSFAYSRRDDTWQLVEVTEYSFHFSNPDRMKTRTYAPPRHFGKIDIAEFDPDNFKGVGPK